MPLLGLCLGGQLVAAAAGATPRRAARPEIGWHQVRLSDAGREDPLLAPLAPGFEAFQWHSYEFPLPPGAVALAQSDVCLQACRVGERGLGDPVPPRGQRRRRPRLDRRLPLRPDAVRIGIDPKALRAETEAKIAAFNQLGRDLCGRWLELSQSA